MAAAAERLVKQVKTLELFSNYIIFDTDTLLLLCPEYELKLGDQRIEDTQGYGFYLWKPILAHAFFTNYWGDVDGIFYLDAGCEVLPNFRAEKQIRNYINQATERGYVVFPAQFPEVAYTKQRVLQLFPNVNLAEQPGQIASGMWFLSGDLGRSLSQLWRDYSEDVKNFDNSFSNSESIEFHSHRHDQSLFSMISKHLGLIPETLNVPGLEGGIKKYYFAWKGPVRFARNRTGTADVFSIYFFAASLNLKFMRALSRCCRSRAR